MGSPTDACHGTMSAVAEPVMRSTPSGRTATSLMSFAAKYGMTIWRLAEVTAEPVQTVDAADDDDALSSTMLMTLPAGSTCPECVLQILELETSSDDRLRSAHTILDRPSNDDRHSPGRSRADHLDRDPLSGPDLPKVSTVGDIDLEAPQ